MSALKELQLTFFSFGYKYGFPEQCNFLLDVRCLPNPYWDAALRPYTGLVTEVADYVLRSEAGVQMVVQLESLLSCWAAQQAAAGKKELSIAIGCTGGRHRSVAVVEALAVFFASQGAVVTHYHRDIDKDDQPEKG